MFKIYEVKNNTTLTPFLEQHYPKKEIKRLLTNDRVTVNRRTTTKFNHPLKPKDEVIVNLNKTDLNVLYEDKDFIIVDKKHNLLSVATDTTTKTLYNDVSKYIKTKNKNSKIFIVNRLDKDTSGIVVFAKNQELKFKLQENWDNVIRKYIAVVIGKTKPEGIIKNYLQEDKNLFVKSGTTGKLAITEYRKLKENKNQTWLDINIKTGRKNQIRVHMNDINCVIKGDTKYGGQKEKRMYLHAYYIKFNHPVTNKIIEVNSIVPKEFS